MNSSPNPTATSAPVASSASSSTTSQASDDKRLAEAIALWLATDNFSAEAVNSHVIERKDALLKNADAIEEKEALRRLNSRVLEAEYQRVAKYAAQKSNHFNEPTLIYIQRAADEWPFRLLTQAKSMWW